jgi:hypothetical protein
MQKRSRSISSEAQRGAESKPTSSQEGVRTGVRVVDDVDGQYSRRTNVDDSKTVYRTSTSRSLFAQKPATQQPTTDGDTNAHNTSLDVAVSQWRLSSPACRPPVHRSSWAQTGTSTLVRHTNASPELSAQTRRDCRSTARSREIVGDEVRKLSLPRKGQTGTKQRSFSVREGCEDAFAFAAGNPAGSTMQSFAYQPKLNRDRSHGNHTCELFLRRLCGRTAGEEELAR